MQPSLRFLAGLAVVALAFAACDKDPAAPTANFALSACPAGNAAVNQPLLLNFSGAVNPSSITGANIIVTNASTGLEIPGGLSVAANGTGVRFTPSAPLPFGTVLGVRVQNVLNAAGTQSTGVTVCNLLTEAAPITELYWDRLPAVSGGLLSGASLFAPDSGYVSDFGVPIFRRVGDTWQVRFAQPYFQSTADVGFVSPVHGWGAHYDGRNGRSVFTQTVDGGLTWDTVFTVPVQPIGRLKVDSALTHGLFGIAGGGNAATSSFFKLNPSDGSWRKTSSFANGFSPAGTSTVNDVDYQPGDTTVAVGVTRGLLLVNTSAQYSFIPGRVYRSTDNGETWAEIAGTAADSSRLGRVVTYLGVALRRNGDIYVGGGNGFFGRISAGSSTITRIPLPLVSLDSTDFTALQITDVEFAPDNDQIGWLIGSQLIGNTNGGVPMRVGFIFGTTDGGATWVRQGVRGAENYGASFPSLFRIEPLSSTAVWIVGQGGLVLTLHP